jgi:hypothetical protein
MLKKRELLIFLIGLFLISLVSAEQVLWDNDTNIKIYDVWRDIDGTPLTGATCDWYVFNPTGTLNQSGTPMELTEGILNFTVNRLEIGIYPMLINCTKGIYNGTSSLREIKIVDELSEEYKDRLVEINQTTKDIYNLLVDDMNATLTRILNLTDLTYSQVVDLETNISNLDTDLSSLRTYLENKWGSEDADKIMEKIKDIRSDVTYLRSRYYYISEEERSNLLIAIREDSREALNLLHGKDKWWQVIWIWIFPSLIILIIVIIAIALSRRKKKQVEDLGGGMNE